MNCENCKKNIEIATDLRKKLAKSTSEKKELRKISTDMGKTILEYFDKDEKIQKELYSRPTR